MNVTSVKRIHQSDWTDSGIRFLRARDIVSASKNEEPDDYLYISKEKYDEYSLVSGKVTIGDLLVTGVGTIGVPYLIRNSEPLYFKDGNIIWFQNGTKIDGDFFLYSFFGKAIQDFINESAGIGTVGTYTIESGKKTPISLPEMKEQQQIGAYFRTLDNLIILHQRKVQIYKKLKKCMLQKMIPKDGEPLFKWRFPKFAEHWEKHKLGNICDVVMGQSPDGSTYSDEPSDYILVQGNADLKDGYVVPRVWTSQKTKTAQAGDLIMSVRAPAGAMGKTAYDVVIGRGVAAIKGNEFIYQTLVKYDADEYWKKLAAGSTFESVNSNEVKSAIMNVPQDIDEQAKIGKYFYTLDKLIDITQQKVDVYKKLKKCMLQKMFV